MICKNPVFVFLHLHFAANDTANNNKMAKQQQKCEIENQKNVFIFDRNDTKIEIETN